MRKKPRAFWFMDLLFRLTGRTRDLDYDILGRVPRISENILTYVRRLNSEVDGLSVIDLISLTDFHFDEYLV